VKKLMAGFGKQREKLWSSGALGLATIGRMTKEGSGVGSCCKTGRNAQKLDNEKKKLFREIPLSTWLKGGKRKCLQGKGTTNLGRQNKGQGST